MSAAIVRNLRENMNYIYGSSEETMQTMLVTRKHNRNVVMVSEELYNNLMKMLM